jgi:hypothetical protein
MGIQDGVTREVGCKATKLSSSVVYQYYGRTYCLQLQGSSEEKWLITKKMEQKPVTNQNAGYENVIETCQQELYGIKTESSQKWRKKKK